MTLALIHNKTDGSDWVTDSSLQLWINIILEWGDFLFMNMILFVVLFIHQDQWFKKVNDLSLA